MTGQEERDVIFARLFGLTAIIRSGLIVRTKPLPFSASSETSASSLASFQETVSNLIALGEKKSWLRESAWWSLGLAIDALNASDVPWKDGAFDATVECVFSENAAWSPEKVAITLKLQNIQPDRDWRKFLCPAFKSPDLLANANLQTLGRVLKVCLFQFTIFFRYTERFRRKRLRKLMQTAAFQSQRLVLGNPSYILSGVLSLISFFLVPILLSLRRVLFRNSSELLSMVCWLASFGLLYMLTGTRILIFCDLFPGT